MKANSKLEEYTNRLEDERFYDVTELEELGLNKTVLRRMFDKGFVDNPARGVYVKSGYEPHLLDEHLVVSKRSPNVVFNLYSAARIHDITQAEPNALWIGLPPNDKNPPNMGGEFYLNIRALRWNRSLDVDVGIETISLRGVDLKLTNPERTVVDMWRYSSHNPSIKGQHVRIHDENMLQCLGAYLEKNEGRTAELGKIAMKLQLPPPAISAFINFVKTYSGGYSFNSIF